MKIELIHREPSMVSALKAFVIKHKLTFHSAEWLDNYKREHIRQCVILNKNNEVIGCFLYYVFQKMAINFVITPPYTPSIELFYVNPSESVVSKATFDKEVMDLIADYFDSLEFSYTGVYLPSTMVDTQPLIWKDYKTSVRYTYQIDLTLSEEELMANLSSEKRKSINKAIKDGLEIRESKDFQVVQQLVLKSLIRNSVDKNISILSNILQNFSTREKCVAFIAYAGGKPSGASVFVIDRERAIYLFGGFDNDNKHHGAGVTCMWHCILKAKQLGLRVFDLEGSMIPGIERYYREFGGKLTPYYKIEKTGLFVKALMRFKGVKN